MNIAVKGDFKYIKVCINCTVCVHMCKTSIRYLTINEELLKIK